MRIAPSVLLMALLAAFAFAWAQMEEETYPWPPEGPDWETDPAVALTRAREEGKAVMAFVATGGCPSCVIMAEEVWPADEVIESSRKIVCLAVYRWGESRGKGTTGATDWAVRFNVMGYPQFRFVDGWARPLPLSDDVPRSKTGILAAMNAAAGAVGGQCEPPEIIVPAGLKDKVPGHLEKEAADPDCLVRAAAWIACLDSRAFSSGELLDLYEWESDPLVRLAVLERIDAESMDDHAQSLLRRAVEGDNDYVREKALVILGRSGTSFAADIVAEAIDKVLQGKSGWRNPNNMLCTAARVSADIRDKSLIPALERILETQTARNHATRLAVDALLAIGERHGDHCVKEALKKRPGEKESGTIPR